MVSQQGQDLREGDEAQEWGGPILALLGEKIPAFGSEPLA